MQTHPLLGKLARGVQVIHAGLAVQLAVLQRNLTDGGADLRVIVSLVGKYIMGN